MSVTYCHFCTFLWQSITCFFDCFRLRHHYQEEVSEKTRLSSLLAAEEKRGCVVKDGENRVQRMCRPDTDAGPLEKVELLKACGTLPETPAETRKAVKFSEKVEKPYMKNLVSDRQLSPDTPASARTEEILPAASGTPEVLQRLNFVDGIIEKLDVQGPCSLSKPSPYPTPRKITDDMQTPGTVYATNMKSLNKGNARIRSQYVYTVLNPTDNLCKLDDLKEEHFATLLPVKGLSEKSVNEKLEDAISTIMPKVNKTPGDEPIVGMVAGPWYEQEETPYISPKWWHGNGIPNSTTKSKEDQKVRTHATPFEERLDKAVSDETCVPQRKTLTGAPPIVFEELEG